MTVTEKLLDLIGTARFVDMTQDLEEGIPYWPTQPRFEAETVDHQSKGCESYWRKITFCEHSGTHIDAFSHFFEGGQNVDEIPLTKIMGRAVNIDATNLPPCGLVTVDDIRAFEAEYGPIEKDDIVFFRFGWDEKWSDTDAFLKDWREHPRKRQNIFYPKALRRSDAIHWRWMPAEAKTNLIRCFWAMGSILLKM